MVSQLDEAMLNHMHYLAFTEGRSFNYLDFQSFEFNGKTYGMTHGTYRNKIWGFKRAGIVETEYNAGPAFHTLKDVHFGNRKRKKTITPSMTPNHMGVSPVASVIKDITKSPLYKEIHKLPPEKRALHDIHLKFEVPDIWIILASSKKHDQNLVSKDISLPHIITDDHLKIHTIVHKTNTVTVSVACSFAPVATDTDGLIRLSNALTRVEERTLRILDECGSMLLGGMKTFPFQSTVNGLLHCGTLVLIHRITKSWSTKSTV